MNMSFVLRLPRKCIFADPLQISHACHHSWKCYKTLTFWSLLTRCTIPTIPCVCHAKRHLNLQKWSVHGVFCTFWLGHVLRATAACTFATSELRKVVREWCFAHFDLETCVAPQRRALFRHLKCQKWSAPLCILTWKCASRHNGVHFFNISTSKSGPNVVCFVHFDF